MKLGWLIEADKQGRVTRAQEAIRKLEGKTLSQWDFLYQLTDSAHQAHSLYSNLLASPQIFMGGSILKSGTRSAFRSFLLKLQQLYWFSVQMPLYIRPISWNNLFHLWKVVSSWAFILYQNQRELYQTHFTFFLYAILSCLFKLDDVCENYFPLPLRAHCFNLFTSNSSS